MYFVVATLGDVDPMYQYSLKYFNQLFNSCIEQSEPSPDLEVRLATLLRNITSSVYTNVARYTHCTHIKRLPLYLLVLCTGVSMAHIRKPRV